MASQMTSTMHASWEARVKEVQDTQGGIAATTLLAKCAHPTRQGLPALMALEDYLKRAHDPYDLVPLGANTTSLDLATLAYIQALMGHSNTAVRTLFRAHRMSPEDGHLWWLIRWPSLKTLTRDLDPDVLTQCLLDVLGAHMRHTHEPLPEVLWHALEPWGEHFPDAAEFHCTLSALWRKGGHTIRAVDSARRAFDAQEDWDMAMNLAYTLREAARFDEAIETMQLASSLAPNDKSCLVELGSTLCQHRRFEEGFAYLEAVLDDEPQHSQAYPTWCFFKQRSTQDESYYLLMESFLRIEPSNPRARRYYSQMTLDAPFVRYLPTLDDASIRAIAPFCETLEQSGYSPAQSLGSFRLDAWAIEAPSVGVSLDLICERYGHDGYDYVLHQEDPPQPDIRAAAAQVKFSLWSYEGLWPTALVSRRAPIGIKRHIASLAKRPYHIHTWWEWAGLIAAQLTGLEADTLPSVMLDVVNTGPSHHSPWSWLHHNQIAAAMVLGQYAAQRQALWQRRVLFDMAIGPADWSNQAALIAMYAWGIHDDSVMQQLRQQLRTLFDACQSWSWCCYGSCLCALTWLVEGGDSEQAQRVKAWYDQTRLATHTIVQNP